MGKILLVCGHPNLSQSTATRQILEQLAPDISVRKLDTLYPHYQIDIKAEQQALIEADLVIIQFPLYWSTYPALLKKWFDDLWTYNFAFGPEGDKLKDKKVILSITAGATEESYQVGDFNFMALEKYLDAALHPVKAAKMNICDVITTFNMNADVNEGGNVDNVTKLVDEHLKKLNKAIMEAKSA
ncbi:NAD(P)H-dependent oxidoreductase [Shewanella gelidii]|uniref:NAD(P)H dehydrogenase (Quinone) n=1 Tax=Shewanella gelidii TaxID=1642821 RepID=A0A917JV19_9GAMM|nr:NAD(P)H-dependent oxidoreductase [Shewanella gelidii]MCL1098645.1 NAD(P)H-dependent oxidoreductase [Shewanella gelidii]GGI86377.1 NAD(P)H dehydrogenase (quinone) [Shewanella gelidii]